jgi:tRNA(Ser,Leu) C12 N-acetylase TAN1
MDPNLIVSYSSSAGYLAGKNEIHAILTKLGDQKSQPELLVPGIIGVATVLKSRDVIEELHDMTASDPDAIKCTLKWVPADNWCDSTPDGIKNTIKEEIKDLMVADDQYLIEILPHRTSLKPDDILNTIKPWLKGRINADHPQKILRIELFDKRASITLLKPKDIFNRE